MPTLLDESLSSATPWTLRRCSLACVGLVFVGFGAIGIMVPGIPGFIFLLLASWCFAKSFPVLERKLLRNRFFAPYMRFMDGDALPAREKANAIAFMWVSTCISIALLWWFEAVPPVLLPLIAVAAGVGTVVILRRGERRSQGRATTAPMAGADANARAACDDR